MSKRTNFKIMSKSDFISHLESNSIKYTEFKTTSVLGVSVIKIKPDHFRLGERVFELKNGKQVDTNVELTNIPLDDKNEVQTEDRTIKKPISKPITKKQLIKLIDDRIQNMGTKGVYHPKRLKPKWNSLTKDSDKLVLFEKYLANKEPSIGLIKLIEVNLCNKTLEAIIIDYIEVLKLLSSDKLLQNCIDKFSRYDNGRKYLKSRGIKITDDKKA